jgi:hypothetical protein
MRKRDLRNLGNNERGVALLIALMALFLIAAVGMGMIYMSNTETAVNQNYKDTQQAFFTMRGGLEEMRDRMRSNAPSPITLPAVTPSSGAAGSIVYITNAAASETVDPKTYGTAYFDDEFCHESFPPLSLTNPGTGVPCGSAGAPPSGAVTTFPSVMPFTGRSYSLKYKWVRLTLKQNGTFSSALVAPPDALHPTTGVGSQVCWDRLNNKEVVLYALGSTYANCFQARAAGLMVEPVYIITALAITPQGSRRIGQYEVAAVNITPPDAGLSLDGPGSGANFGPPNSNNGAINGNDGSGPAPPALAGCNTDPAVSVPAIGTSDIADETLVAGDIPGGRTGNYQGTAPQYPLGVAAIPSVVDMGSDPSGTNKLGNWSTPGQLNNMVAQLANAADYSYNCSMNGGPGTACSGTYGSVASPQITYINGDAVVIGGAGVLVVTGTLTFNGHLDFDGLILVIGQGNVVVGGGANTAVYGAVFVATTNSATSPYAQLPSLAAPAFKWNGGGKAGVYYNSCWANYGNAMHYMVVASREEMY